MLVRSPRQHNPCLSPPKTSSSVLALSSASSAPPAQPPQVGAIVSVIQRLECSMRSMRLLDCTPPQTLVSSSYYPRLLLSLHRLGSLYRSYSGSMRSMRLRRLSRWASAGLKKRGASSTSHLGSMAIT